MDESSLEKSLELYRTQLSQVELAITAAAENEDLKKLKEDLKELIGLTEESLLSVKKSNILQSLEETAAGKLNKNSGETTKTAASSRTPDDAFDAEYAAFQAALAEDVTQRQSTIEEETTTSELNEEQTADSPDYSELVGMKCRVPFSHDWGGLSYHNAIISGVDDKDHCDLPEISVMFCHPTHISMLPCNYYLEGNCRFSDKDCRYSHGYSVSLEDLQEFKDPDYSKLTLESKCLGKYDDDLWYKATVVDILDDHKYTIMFDSYSETLTLDIKDIVPLEENNADLEEDDLDENDDDDRVKESLDDDIHKSDDEDDLPVYLYKPSTVNYLGEWEHHTKGIASKLMAKMGYNAGEGLGKNSQGRTEPVPILLLPQGKSLDKIMELKQLAGEQDLFDVMKKQEKKKKAKEKKIAEGYFKPKPAEHNMFDFINRKLAHKKGNLKDLIHKEHLQTGNKKISRHHRNLSEDDLKKKSDKSLNIQLFKTDEEKKNVRKEIERLKQALLRNEQRDKNMAQKIRLKILSMEEYLQRLETSEQTIQRHQQKRSDNKKLTVF